MSFLHWLNGIRGDGAPKASSGRPTVRPILEFLEDRITPADFGTYTNVTVQIIPNLFNLTVTEKVTANVTVNGTFDPITHAFTPGTGPAVSTGKVLFNLNNQQQSASVNSNGQATATFTLPLLTLFTSQTLDAQYKPVPLSAPPLPEENIFEPSEFLAPLYTNFDNLIFVATLTFGTLTPQQQTATIDPTTHEFTALPSFNTAQGESNNMGVLNFHYDDPGTITTFEVFGFTLPGSLAFKVGAFGPEFM